MGSLSNYLENELLDHVFGNGAYSAPTIYVGLSTADPLDDGSGLAEPSGNGYARVAHASWTAAANRKLSNNGGTTFPQPTGSWGTMTHYALFDADSGGNMLAHGELDVPKIVDSGPAPSIANGEIEISFLTGGATNYLAHKLLDLVFSGTAYTPPTIHVALSTANPTDAGSDLTEPGNGYAREAVSGWETAAGGATENSADIEFDTPTGSWGMVTHTAIMDALTSGNCLGYAALGASQSPDTGDPVLFPAGDFNVTLD